MKSPVFLTAQWRHLLMINYAVDPALLQPFVPVGTEIDYHNGKTYVSIVAFLMIDTRVMGIPIPLHQNFEEVNLRFYVRRKGPEGWRRGVVFIRELVPRLAIAAVARIAYNEKYSACSMSHHLFKPPGSPHPMRYEFFWKYRGEAYAASAKVEGEPKALEKGSEEQFIAEHYWGYAAQRDGSTVEYRVEHPSWRVWSDVKATLKGDLARLYGYRFKATLEKAPTSIFLAEGSKVRVRQGVKIPDQ